MITFLTYQQGTLCEAAKALKEQGALNIYAFATHGL